MILFFPQQWNRFLSVTVSKDNWSTVGTVACVASLAEIYAVVLLDQRAILPLRRSLVIQEITEVPVGP